MELCSSTSWLARIILKISNIGIGQGDKFRGPYVAIERRPWVSTGFSTYVARQSAHGQHPLKLEEVAIL